MSQRTITIPMNREAPRCEGPDAGLKRVKANGEHRNIRECLLPAAGVYAWETVHFGAVKRHAAILCATCAIAIANRVQPYLDDREEMRYSRPNKNLHMDTLFTYEKPVVVEYEPVRAQQKQRRLSAPVGKALIRNALHDQRVDNSNYRGNPHARWYKTVECPSCHVKFARASTRKCCPGCGGKVP